VNFQRSLTFTVAPCFTSSSVTCTQKTDQDQTKNASMMHFAIVSAAEPDMDLDQGLPDKKFLNF
jgi:hypothetical protein